MSDRRTTSSSDPTPTPRGHRSLLMQRAAALILALAGALPSSTLAAERSVRVSYVTASAVYLDAGRAEGLAVGQRLKIVRGGEELAEVEVDFVAEHSASCRVVSSRGAVQGGDEVVWTVAGEEPEAVAPPPVAPAPEPATPTPYVRPTVAPEVRTRVTGSFALAYRSLADDLGPTSDESTARLSLRVRNIGGHPWDLRVRARRREISRDGFGPSVARNQDSDRLYELSLAWVPPRGRFHVYLGRLGAGPFSSLGDLDGALGEVRLGRSIWLGAFGGSRPEIAELGLKSAGTKYGAFARLAHESAVSPFYAELLLGGVVERDDSGETSRDFVAVESRFGSGASWWISQRAEVDVNRDWRKEVSGRSSEVSNAAIAGSFRLSESWRATLSYDQRRNLLTAETRPRPEEVFLRYFREGGRAALEWRSRGGWSASIGAGTERADSLDKATSSAFLSLMHTRAFGAPLLLGVDGSFYDGGTAQGWVASLRSRWAFRGGHDVGLTVGASQTDVGAGYLLTSRSNQWARLSGTVQLPMRLWLYGEYEMQTGDDFEGNRAFVEVGYRF